MKRWKMRFAAAAVALGAFAGCQQPLYMTVDDHRSVTSKMPANLDIDPDVAAPRTDVHAAPPTVSKPDRPPRYVSLQECIAIALESGTRGSAASGAFGGLSGGFGTNRIPYIDDTSTISFTGGVVSNIDDSIKAFALDPAIVGTNIEGALAKFDARWTTSMSWSKADNATTSTFTNLSNGDTAAFSSGLYKPLPTGGLASITFNTNYTRLSNPPSTFAVVNPAYTPSVQVGFEQPLLRSFGIAINQLLPAHPGSIQLPNFLPTGGRSEGILITRVRYDQSRAEFERNVAVMLLNVEYAYWVLYENYFANYAAAQGIRQSFITWQLTLAQQVAGTKTAQDVAQVRATFETFRSQYINSLAQVYEGERQLRGLLGMPQEDGTRLVPADAPSIAPYAPDFSLAVNEAWANRPELLILRHEVKARQFDLLVQQNSMRPDVRFFSNYNVNAIGTSLAGSGPNAVLGTPGNAYAALADNKFNSWTLGLRADIPIGFRDASASVRTAQLNLARTYQNLKNQEEKTKKFVGAVYQSLDRYYLDIAAQRERRKALGLQLEGLFARFKAGKDPLLNILTAQNDFASALQSEHSAIGNYNIAIATFQFSKGTLLQYNNVQIGEGPLPECTMVRATDHFRERTEGLILRERETLPTATDANPLPRLLEHQPPIPETSPDGKSLSMTPGSTKPLPQPMGGILAPGTPTAMPTGTPTQPQPVGGRPDMLPIIPEATDRR